MAFAEDCIKQYGKCLNEVPVMVTNQYSKQQRAIVFRDRSGQPINLTPYLPESPEGGSSSSSSSSGSPARYTNVVMLNAIERWAEKRTYIRKWGVVRSTEAAEGIVRFNFTPHDLRYAGIWIAELTLWDQARDRVAAMPLYLEVDPTLNVNIRYKSGVITVPEIRLALRDVCPEQNFLIDDVEFSDSEIVWAITQPIDQWNGTPPPVGTYTPPSWPWKWRYYWRIGVVAELLRVAAYHYTRNSLDYSASGVSVRDKDKYNLYMQLADRAKAEWETWMRRKKYELNVEAVYGGIASPYAYIGGSAYYYRW